jgi:CheY-like chemotaxis protein
VQARALPIADIALDEGFATILKHRPDLVLCDINMPVMSGFQVLEQLLEIAPQFGHIPFVFLTAMADRESELRGRRLWADDIGQYARHAHRRQDVDDRRASVGEVQLGFRSG